MNRLSLFFRLVLFAGALVMPHALVAAEPRDTPTGQVPIVVVDETGGLVPHATVSSLGPRSYSYDQAEWKPVELDALAHGSFDGEVGKQYYLRAVAADYAPSYVEIYANGFALVEPTTVTLWRGATVRGKLVHKDPIATASGTISAEFWKINENNRQGRLGNYLTEFRELLTTASLAPDGTFEMQNMPPGDVRFQLNMAGYTTDDFEFEQLLFGVPKTGVADIEIPVVRTGYLAGRVTYRMGEPAAGITLEVTDTEDWRHSFGRAKTDQHGRFRILNVPELDYRLAAADGIPGHLDNQINVDDIELRITKSRDPEPRDFKVRGRVWDAVTNKPFAGKFTVEPIPNSVGPKTVEYSIEEPGRFTVFSPDHLDGSDIKVWAEGYLPVKCSLAGDAVSKIALAPPGRLSGIVVDSKTSAPVAGVRLWSEKFQDYQTSTSADGKFEFPVYPAEVMDTLVVRPEPAHVETTMRVKAEPGTEATSITIAVDPALAWHGRLVQGREEIPVVGEEFEFGGTAKNLEYGGVGKTDADGRFTAYGTEDKTRLYLKNRRLEVYMPESRAGDKEGFTVKLGTSTVVVENSRGNIGYFDMDATIDGLDYRYCSNYSRQNYLMATDEGGRATVTGLPAGQWRLAMRNEAPYGNRGNRNEPVIVTVDVPEAGEVEVRVSE